MEGLSIWFKRKQQSLTPYIKHVKLTAGGPHAAGHEFDMLALHFLKNGSRRMMVHFFILREENIN